jgi:ABC-2 type transport system permease protein
MTHTFKAFWAGARAEFRNLLRSKIVVALATAQAVTFLVLVSLFGVTGARAPTALIDYDGGAVAQQFVASLKAAHHSFDLRVMDKASADQQLRRGDIVAMIMIPREFSQKISQGRDVSIRVVVDNINTDMTDDIERALPSAIASFGRARNLPNILVQVVESDLIDHDTGYIPYLVVSALVSAALIIAGVLGAVAMAREYEAGTNTVLRLAPVSPLVPLLGRILATWAVSSLALAVAAAIVIFGYGVSPLHPLEMAAALLSSTLVFSILGMALGIALKRSLPVVSIVFGMALPCFMVSGSYEPESFDGHTIWMIAHFSPVYYAVGIVEHAAHGLHVTPESVAVNFLALAGWAVLSLGLAVFLLKREVSRC